MAAVWGYKERLRILCTRQIQASIKESFYAELVAAIERVPWLKNHYQVLENGIRGRNGTEFIFRGLHRNIGSVKSLAKIDLCIIEEAEDVSEDAWKKLVPTIRAKGSEIWVVWNPEIEGSPVDSRFIQHLPARAMVVEMNHSDNPWWTEELEEERLNDQARLDPAEYAHIWEGDYLRNSNKAVLGGRWRVAEFEPSPDWSGPYHGIDFGFSMDPTTGVRCWIDGDRLLIEHEAGKRRLELDETAEFLRSRIPGFEKFTARADSARPESISYLSRNGLPRIEGVDKWPGSVEDGIQHLRAFREIVIHPRCKETIREARLYSHKVDKESGDVLPQIVDAYNHYWDAVRYALAPMIRRGGAPMDLNIGMGS